VTYKIRNTLVLGIIWFIIAASGVVYYWIILPKQIKKIKKEITIINKQLEDLPGLTDEVQRLTIQFQDVKRRYDSRSKEIPQLDISSQTYEYMSNGVEEAGFIKFNMKFMGQRNKSSWGFNSYKLERGEAQFENLFRFIYFLENGRRLYKIASIDLEHKEAIDDETKEVTKWIAFDMEIHAYFVRNIPELGTSLAAKSLTMIPSPFDPFNNMITEILSTEVPRGEIDADKAEVKAVLPGKVFVEFDNALQILHLGDKVWRGSVSRVNPESSSVDYSLNEGGVFRRLTKKIIFDKR
jgi:hypothetical protein